MLSHLMVWATNAAAALRKKSLFLEESWDLQQTGPKPLRPGLPPNGAGPDLTVRSGSSQGHLGAYVCEPSESAFELRAGQGVLGQPRAAGGRF